MKKEHGKGCNVLGRYCFTHKVKTEAGIPGWGRPSKGPGVGYSLWARNEETGDGYTESIIWANGDTHRRKDQTECSLCGKNCGHPVERGFLANRDKYREIRVSEVKAC